MAQSPQELQRSQFKQSVLAEIEAGRVAEEKYEQLESHLLGYYREQLTSLTLENPAAKKIIDDLCSENRDYTNRYSISSDVISGSMSTVIDLAEAIHAIRTSKEMEAITIGEEPYLQAVKVSVPSLLQHRLINGIHSVLKQEGVQNGQKARLIGISDTLAHHDVGWLTVEDNITDIRQWPDEYLVASLVFEGEERYGHIAVKASALLEQRFQESLKTSQLSEQSQHPSKALRVLLHAIGSDSEWESHYHKLFLYKFSKFILKHPQLFSSCTDVLTQEFLSSTEEPLQREENSSSLWAGVLGTVLEYSATHDQSTLQPSSSKKLFATALQVLLDWDKSGFGNVAEEQGWFKLILTLADYYAVPDGSEDIIIACRESRDRIKIKFQEIIKDIKRMSDE